MKIITNLSNYKSTKKTFVTLGTFDGVHIGHQKVIKNLVESSKLNNATSVLVTFFPHPRMVLQKNADIKLINTIEERIQLLEKTGLEILVIYEFTETFAKQTAEEFVKTILVDKLNVAKLVIGYDHQFGKNRDGSFEQLKALGKEANFEVEKISQQDIDNAAVSSTTIRNAIENGKIKKANNYLGQNYLLTGKVVKGRNLGEQIGFPTANLHIKEAYKLLPKTGAYVVKSEIDNIPVFGMMNIGYRPTVSGKNQTIEIHFFDFKKNLYNETIQVEMLQFLREEQKFDSVDTLKKQLQKDKENSLEIINGLLLDL